MEVISDNESRLPEIDEETSLSLQSTTSEDYIQMVQSLIKEHKEIRQRLQKANEILQNDFAIIRKRLQEVNEKYADQCAANELLERDNATLKQVIAVREARMEILDEELKDVQKKLHIVRTSELIELEELKQALLEKDHISRTMMKTIQRLEEEKEELRETLSTVKEEYDQQIEVMQKEMSDMVAKNLDLEKTDKTNMADINTQKTQQTVIHQNDSESKQTSQSELAHEKDRILTERKLNIQVQSGQGTSDTVTNESINAPEAPVHEKNMTSNTAGSVECQKQNGLFKCCFSSVIIVFIVLAFLVCFDVYMQKKEVARTARTSYFS
ncbi:DNA repair protein RecN-like isoform X2 [Aedes albopictus]|uniref:Uncharacterized protein n=1 Tax=Aedes albopictus TaxID=7160 RepID=A0ABM1XLC4_AEDAL